MVVNLEYLRKKYLKNFQNDEELFNFVSADVVFGFSQLYQILKKNSGINSVLEIGSGTGILLNELKISNPKYILVGGPYDEWGINPSKRFSIVDKYIKSKNAEINRN